MIGCEERDLSNWQADPNSKKIRFEAFNPLQKATKAEEKRTTILLPGQGAAASWQSHVACGQLFYQSHIQRQKW
jgi:hypothetical protein